MRNTFTALSLAMLWPYFSSAQAADAMGSSGFSTNEKLMLFAFIIAAILLFIAGKIAYDMIFRKKH